MAVGTAGVRTLRAARSDRPARVPWPARVPDPLTDPHPDLPEALRGVLGPADPPWTEPPAGRRRAAVLALLQPGAAGSGPSLLFTVRVAAMREHAGEVAFPGGRHEPGESPRQTALREAAEEVGLRPGEVAVLGSLPARSSSTGFCVETLVGWRASPRPLRPEPREVAAILEADVAALAVEERWQWRTMRVRRGGPQRMPCYDVDGHRLWGLTAVLTRELLARIAQVAGRRR